MSVTRLHQYADALVRVSDNPFSIIASERATLAFYRMSAMDKGLVHGFRIGSRDPTRSIFEKTGLYATMRLIQEIQCLSSS
jgi:hypothetical protein